MLPHQHENQKTLTQHEHHEKKDAGHHKDDHDNDEDGDPSLSHDLNHSSEFGKVISKRVSSNDFLLKTPSHFILLQVYVLGLGIERPPIIRPPIENSSFHSSVFCYCLPLRAPPALA